MTAQGIQLPVELQIQNLQEIASQLRKFTNNNILSSSFGGKKIESELDKILSRLEQVQAKTKTAFTTNSNFSSVEKDVTQIELGLNRVRQNIANLTFKDLKIPSDVQGQIEALQGRIRELNNSLLTFKGTQKENLVNNQSFMANLKVAEPTQAAKILEKGYDDLYQAINTGMNKVNTTLALKAAAFKEQQEIFTQNSAGKSAMTQWGALGFIQEAFKALPKDDSKKSETQKLMSSIMNYSAGDKKSGGEFTSFQRGAIGQNSFLKAIQKQFEFTPEEMNDIRNRLKQQAIELKTSVTQVLKQMGSDDTLAKNVLFGPKVNIVENLKQQYEDQQAAVKKLETEYNTEKTRSEAYANVQAAFEAPNQAIAQKAQEISIALEAPTAALEQYQQALLQTVMTNPELAASFGAAAQNISAITGAIDAGRAKLEQMDQTISKMQGVSSFINRYIGVYAIARKVTQAIRNAFNNIKELDKSITNIAVVTNMSQTDLWNKIGDYTSMAQQFGVATKDVYTVSQLFYQQGLQTNQVMSLTTETLKMAKISGMGYEEAANAMTVAIRAFKIEMTDAQQVTDTYSALAAKFAVSSAEIANAMEKTASSAANVGMSLQSTSAFMSVMIQTTRESAQNIGSALKSIISRYGEMKASPSTLLNVDGEEVAFNKVDTALKSVGISIKDASGQFRDFDDVIMELAAKWDSLDNNTQRYIATVMAGNRQQSRFIALVSNYDELNRAMNVASSSENASIVQVAKTMDSLESKTNQLRNAFDQLYLDLHLEEGLKGAYDWLTRIVSTIGKLGMLKGVLPTLMTAINAGFGVKGLINMGIDKYKQRRTDLQMQVDADITKARPQIESLIKDATTPRNMPINTQVDDTQLKDVEARLNNISGAQRTAGTVPPVVTTPAQMTPVSVNDFYSKLYAAQAAGNLATVQGRAETLADMGVSEDSGAYSQLSAMMASFTGAASAADEMATVFATATGQIVTTTAEVETAVNTVASEITQEAAEHANNTGAIQNNTNAVMQNAQAMQSSSALFGLLSGTLSNAVNSLGQLALPAGQLTGSFMQLMPPISLAGTEIYGMVDGVQTSAALLANGLKEPTNSLGLLAGTLVTVKEAADGASYALFKIDGRTRNKQLNLPGKVDEGDSFIPSTEKSHWYSKFFQKNKDTGKTEFSRQGFQAMSIATGAARMLAPVITAIGASIKDKSTDRFESSKIFTGLGNGLSGAATGAQIGMAAGPWGAAIGALGGFVLNGLSAIIDGANYTLTERIANLKQEAQEAADESLKRQAKVIDLSSTIDNLKNLHNAMYNSAEDMQAYQDAIGTAADSYPELISAYDEAGNAIIDLQAAETALSEARLAGARAAKTAAIKELEVSDKQIELYNKQTAYTGHISNLEKYINFKQTYPNGISRQELKKYINDPVMHSIGRLDQEDRLDDSWKKTELYEFNKWIEENASTIGKQNLWDLTGIDTNKKFIDWDLNDVQLAINSINSIVKKANTTNNLLKDQVNAAIGLESFLSFINFDNGISQEQVSQLETSKNFQNLFNRTLLNLKPEEYDNLNEWQTAENSNFSSEVSKLYNESFKTWYDSLSAGLKEAFNNLDYTEYKNADELVRQFNLEGTGLEAGFIDNFIQANKANRERILKTIYQYENGEKTNQFNEDLTGIIKINRQKDAKDIADRFTQKIGAKGKVLASAKIISKYADYFSEQLINIDKLADDGYVALAATRFDALNNLSETLGKIKESSIQNDLFGVITSIDLSSYASISSAYESIKEYGKENDKVAEVAPLLASLVEAQNNLIYNVNTVAQELTSIITSAAKDIDDILSTNKSGISFDKAIETFDKLNAQFADITNFNDVFTFDAILDRYVYTTNGLQKAIEAKEKELANTVEQLNDSAEIYTKIIATNKNGEWDTEAAFTEISNWDVTPEELFQNMRDLQIINTDNLKVQNAYQELIKGYLDSTKIAERSGESFEQYIEQRAQEVSEMQGAAQVLLEQYQFNKRSQYYQAIDWSKLALGTDYTGTNKLLVKSLAKELGLYTETYNEAGKLIATHWEAGYSEEDWEKILQEFLNKEYAGNDAGRAAAEAAIRSALEQSKVEQVSNAISELLSNEVASLSANSIALIQQLEGYGTQFEVDGEGQLQILDAGVKEGITNISLALEEYQINVANGTLNTISKINEEYTKIINASFAKSQATQTLLSSGNTLDFNTIESTFSSLEVELDDYWNSTTQTWKNGLEDVFETDIFGRTKIKSWDKYLQWIANKRETSVDEIKKSPEYDKYWSSYVDAVISDQDSQDIEKQVANTLSTLANAKAGARVNVSALSPAMQRQLDGNADGIYTVVSEAMRDQAILALEATGSTESDVIIRELQRSIKSKNAKGNIINGVANKNISNDAMRKYLDQIIYPNIDLNNLTDKSVQLSAESRGFIWDEYTQSYRATLKAVEDIREQITTAETNGTATPEYIAELKTLANQLEIDLSKNPAEEALRALLANYTNAEGQLATFEAYFGKLDDEYKYTDEKGNVVIKVAELREKLGDEYSQIFTDAMNQIADSYINNVSKIGQFLTEGTTSQTEMAAFQTAYSQLMGGETIDFFYDSVLQAWTFDASKLRGYLEAAASKLNLGENSSQWVEDQIEALTVDNLDFSAYLSGSASQKDQNKLRKNLKDYFKTHTKQYNMFGTADGIEQWATSQTDDVLATLAKGGQDAINELKNVKGELTTEEISAAYRAQVEPLKSLFDTLDELQVGSVVAGNQINALRAAGFQVNDNGLVESVGNLVEAYKSLYDQMKNTSEATLAELNTAMGKYLDNRDGQQQAIDALGNATNMTFSQLAEIYTQAGIELTEELVDAMEEVGIIKGLGGNKLMIQDFRAFAKQMNWGEGSEEYINAFKAYNDSLIEYDRQTEKSIVEEIKNVAAAKPGDKINLTHFVSQLENGLDTILVATGARIQNGILTISEGADLADITNQLLAMVPESVELIPDEIAEIADAVNAILQQIASLIKEGINGTLSNANKQSLTSWGNANGLNLQFTQTAEGFKLAQSSAIEVYNTLKSIDALQGKLVFDELNKSLQESNEHYKSISDVANRIKAIESIAPDARSKEYAQELALAKEIYAVRSTTEDSSFSFMSNKIPGAQNNPINYFNNWAQAIHTFNDALKTQGTYTKGGKTYQSGFVDYDFWYNLVTEMNNIAALGGNIEFAGEELDGSLEAASKLIQKGAESLVVTNTGEVKVALSGMSLDFAAGADAFSSNVTEGIQALAKSQSKMLDGLIKLLEAVVAMEKLGDIDVGNNGILDLSELFEVKTGEQNWTIAEKNLVGFNAFIEQAGDSLDSIIINGQKFTDLAEKAKVEGLDKAMAENFTAIMNSLYQMYRSGDYNLDNLYDSIQQIMAQSKFTGELQLGDTILHVKNGAVIIETEDKKGKKKFQTPNGEVYDTMGEAIARSAVMAQGVKDGITYEGEIATGDIEIKTLGANITITSDKEGNLTFKNGDGEPISAANINEYVQTLIDAQGLEPTEAAKLKTNVGLEIGTIKLDSFSYKSIDSKIREEFEKKLASGSQIEVDAFIDANPVLKQFKGKTGAEIQEILHLDDVKIIVDNKQAIKGISAVEEQLRKLHDKTITITTINKEVSDKSGLKKTGNNTQGILQPLEPISPRKKTVGATGNIGLADAKGTLMGELGPELVVSKGRYFVVGQAGPEMVNLADDAIVFNHLQTESLLKKGMSKGRGKAVTNERNAVSFATGNVNGGPAKASASAALAALRQLKAQWDALAGLSAKDLAGKGGGGGGGGGDPKAFLKDLERWYDWLQQIAQLEKEITLEEAKRTEYQSHMVARGKEYFTSQLASLELLQEQAVVQKSLNDSQEEYFQKRLKEINEQSAFSALYGFSESGQLYYKDVYADGKSAFEWLSDLVGRNEVTGEANYTAEEQYNKLVAAGFGFAMEYDSSGNKIKQEGTDWYNTALQAFWDKIDRDKEEMQSLHDSVEDGKKKLLDLENAQNEILHEIEDNQIEVEQKVLKAIEEARQREIDELKDTKEAIENSTKEFTDGLNKQLDKERQMRDNQANADELATLQRRLNILQRSGGSAAEIRDLQQQINDKQYDKYFDMQEQQIQAIQDSSDAQIERLDNQIELMEETLAYEKENGLLWADVDEILKKSSEDIVSFIQGNTSEYWNKSTTELQKVLREDLFEVDRFKQFQATVEDGIEALIMKFGTEEQKKALADKKRAENPVTSTDNSNINTSSAKSSGSSGGNNSAKKPQNKKYGFKYTFNGKPAMGEQSWDSAEKAKSVALISINEDATRLINSKKYSSIGAVKQMVEQAKKTITAYSTGGYDYTTGIAMLHGTKSRPESVFNAEQTRILREQFLSNHPDSVISLLKDYREAYRGLSANTYDSIQNNSNATTIEHAEVNLSVDKLANDYDAKRAANTIMDEMLRIASKTSANNSVRR